MGIKFIDKWYKSNILERRKNCQIFNFQDVQTGSPETKYSAPQQLGQKIIANQSKPILVIVLIKLFTCQSF